jgi:hypothetical protein
VLAAGDGLLLIGADRELLAGVPGRPGDAVAGHALEVAGLRVAVIRLKPMPDEGWEVSDDFVPSAVCAWAPGQGVPGTAVTVGRRLEEGIP